MTPLPGRAHLEWIAHRGESHDAPENTLPAILLAWERGGADAVEIDLRLTRDSALVAIHDPDTLRVAGVKHIVAETDLEKLRSLDVGRWKAPRWAGAKIPTLDEALATVPSGKKLLLELKTGPECVPELARCIARARCNCEQIVIISFNADSLREARRLLPQHQRYYLASIKQDEQTGAWSPGVDELIERAQAAGAQGLDVSAVEPVNREFIARVKSAELSCHVWTVDDPALARRMRDAGADSITTNRAAWLSRQLAQR